MQLSGFLSTVSAKTPAGPAGFDIMTLSAAGVLDAADAVATETIDHACALCGPPEHRAEMDQASGFCLPARGARAVKRVRSAPVLKSGAVTAWDVPHGNGTEKAFLTTTMFCRSNCARAI